MVPTQRGSQKGASCDAEGDQTQSVCVPKRVCMRTNPNSDFKKNN